MGKTVEVTIPVDPEAAAALEEFATGSNRAPRQPRAAPRHRPQPACASHFRDESRGEGGRPDRCRNQRRACRL